MPGLLIADGPYHSSRQVFVGIPLNPGSVKEEFEQIARLLLSGIEVLT
jgi:hypothetical protein